MEIGVVGKPNVGKSTFFNAATLSDAEVASYPFTTVKANRAVGFLKAKCVCREFDVECNPRNSRCIDGNRFVPVDMIDVAGLVPDAHTGKGLGNQFLDELRQASALLHVVDASGATDPEGNPVALGSHDPVEDVRFLENEIEQWFFGIFKRNWTKISRKSELEKRSFGKYFEEMFIGIGIKEGDVIAATKEVGLDIEKPSRWGDKELLEFAKTLRRVSKPIIIAANKSDVGISEQKIKGLGDAFEHLTIIPTSSMAELVLRNLESQGAIRYIPGDSGFEVIESGKINAKNQKALEIIQSDVFDRYGNTGVQQCIDHAIYNILNKIVVYPVEDENKLTDKDGNVLPDAFLMDSGSTALDLAYKIHTDIGESFIGAIDARTKRKIGKDYELKNLDVIKILTS